MKIVVLDSSPYGNASDARSDGLLVSAALARGHDASIRSSRGVRWNGGGVILADGAPLEADLVLGRADLRSRDDLSAFTALLRAVTAAGMRALPSPEGLLTAEDKSRTHEALVRAGVGVAPTTFVRTDAEGRGACGAVAAFPVALKTPVGWGGHGVVRCDDEELLARAVTAFDRRAARQVVLLQPWLDGPCVTLQVARDDVIAAFVRRAEGGFDDVAPPASAAGAAVRATAACGLLFASVDVLLPIGGGLAVLDVNAMPGIDPDDAGDRAFAAAIVRAAEAGA